MNPIRVYERTVKKTKKIIMHYHKSKEACLLRKQNSESILHIFSLYLVYESLYRDQITGVQHIRQQELAHKAIKSNDIYNQ